MLQKNICFRPFQDSAQANGQVIPHLCVSSLPWTPLPSGRNRLHLTEDPSTHISSPLGNIFCGHCKPQKNERKKKLAMALKTLPPLMAKVVINDYFLEHFLSFLLPTYVQCLYIFIIFIIFDITWDHKECVNGIFNI